MAPNHTANTIRKLANWLDHDVLPVLGDVPVAKIKPRDILMMLQRVETRGAIDSAHRIQQMCGQIQRFGVALGWLERDVTPDLKGALASVPGGNFAAITEPKEVGALMRAIYGYNGHVVAVAALKLAPLLFVRPGELRAAEWAEFDLDVAEWRIPAAKIKMKKEHVVPLPLQAVAILRDLHRVTGQGHFVFPGFRSDDVYMRENPTRLPMLPNSRIGELLPHHRISADYSLPSWEGQVHTEHPDKDEGDEPQAQEQ